jgi:hypothetical protein
MELNSVGDEEVAKYSIRWASKSSNNEVTEMSCSRLIVIFTFWMRGEEIPTLAKASVWHFHS